MEEEEKNKKRNTYRLISEKLWNMYDNIGTFFLQNNDAKGIKMTSELLIHIQTNISKSQKNKQKLWISLYKGKSYLHSFTVYAFLKKLLYTSSTM